jgi:hypothetical protein
MKVFVSVVQFYSFEINKANGKHNVINIAADHRLMQGSMKFSI